MVCFANNMSRFNMNWGPMNGRVMESFKNFGWNEYNKFEIGKIMYRKK